VLAPFSRQLEHDRIGQPSLMMIEFDGHDIFLKPRTPASRRRKSPSAVFLKAVQNVVVVFQWLPMVVVKPSHDKAICGEHYRAGHIEAETAVLYG
jgi:hypothetical protein